MHPAGPAGGRGPPSGRPARGPRWPASARSHGPGPPGPGPPSRRPATRRTGAGRRRSRLCSGMPAGHADQPGMTASSCPTSTGRPVTLLDPQGAEDPRVPAGGGRRDAWCARPASPGPGRASTWRDGRGRGGLVVGQPDRGDHGRLVVHVRGGGTPSYSTTSRRLPYGLSLVSRISGRPGRAARLLLSAPAQSRHTGNLLIRPRSSCPHPGYVSVRNGLSNGAQVPGRPTPTRPPRHLADLDPRSAARPPLSWAVLRSAPTSWPGTTSPG